MYIFIKFFCLDDKIGIDVYYESIVSVGYFVFLGYLRDIGFNKNMMSNR